MKPSVNIHAKLNEQQMTNGRSEGLNTDAEIDLEMKIPKRLDEIRKKSLLVFFIDHFIALVKKSNEFRAYGQSLMLVLQSQNLLKLMEELGYGETQEFAAFRIELEKLRSISRVGTEGYWKVNWGYYQEQDSRESSTNKQHIPLPDLPSMSRRPSPIIGTEEGDNTIAFVEVHEIPNDCTTNTDM